MAIRKICGIETEYGIVFRGVEDPNPITASSILINSYLSDLTKSGGAAHGAPRVGWEFEYETPGADGRGEVLAKSIEQSNVDIASEFISLMAAQRNFQANTRTITTSDQMLQEVLNIKR